MIVRIKLLIPALILLLFTLSGCRKVSTDNSQNSTLKEYPMPGVAVSVFEYDYKASSFQDKEFPLSENEKAYLYHIISTSQRSSDILKSGSGDYLIIVGNEEWYYIRHYKCFNNYEADLHIPLSDEQMEALGKILPDNTPK